MSDFHFDPELEASLNAVYNEFHLTSGWRAHVGQSQGTVHLLLDIPVSAAERLITSMRTFVGGGTSREDLVQATGDLMEAAGFLVGSLLPQDTQEP